MSSNINNFLISLLGLAVLSSIFFGKEKTIESFGMNPSQTVVVNRVSDGVNVANQYQQMLNPAAQSAQSAIRYQSQVSQPLSFVGSIREAGVEGYCNGGSCNTVAGCRRGSGGALGDTPKSANMMPSGYNASSMIQSPMGAQAVDMLPVQSMANAQSQVVNALGEASLQPIVYDRYIYSNQRSKLYGQGDPIRGDLPIVPNNMGWFSPSVRPNVDLRAGALMVMGGTENAVNSQLLAMQNAASGGLADTGSGIAYTAQKNNYLSTGSSDIRVTSFP